MLMVLARFTILWWFLWTEIKKIPEKRYIHRNTRDESERKIGKKKKYAQCTPIHKHIGKIFKKRKKQVDCRKIHAATNFESFIRFSIHLKYITFGLVPSIVCSSFKFNYFFFLLAVCFCYILCRVRYSFSFTYFLQFFLVFALSIYIHMYIIQYSNQTLLHSIDELKVSVMPIIEFYHLFNIFRLYFTRIEIIQCITFHRYIYIYIFKMYL